MDAVERIERLFKSQDRVRRLYHSGDIEAALIEFRSVIAGELDAVDPRISRCASRIARSFISMVDDDLAQTTA